MLLAVRLVAGGGPSGAVVAGDAFVGPRRPKDLAVVHGGSTGYDGQFVYRLALDPFTRERTAHGITLDNPPYRQQRIGLPLATWALHATARLPVSWALLVVNAAAVLAATAAGAVLARRLGRHALLGVLVGLSPALVVGLCRDLTEPLATALLLGGLVAWTGGRPGRATAAFVAAVLTRETSLAVLAGLGLWEAYVAVRDPARRVAATKRAALLLVPLAAFAAWQAHLRDVWGVLPLSANEGDVGTPILHTIRTLHAGGGPWSDWSTKDALLRHAWVAERFVLLAVLLATAAAIARRRTAATAATATAWVVAALLALSTAWTRDVAFLRAANEAVVVGTIVLLGARTRAAAAGLVATAGLSAFAGVMYAALL